MEINLETMIDRVAKAIVAAMTDPVELYDPVALAQAAIEAMREPTEAMIKAANDADACQFPNDAKKCWSAMIEEAMR